MGGDPTPLTKGGPSGGRIVVGPLVKFNLYTFSILYTGNKLWVIRSLKYSGITKTLCLIKVSVHFFNSETLELFEENLL